MSAPSSRSVSNAGLRSAFSRARNNISQYFYSCSIETDILPDGSSLVYLCLKNRVRSTSTNRACFLLEGQELEVMRRDQGAASGTALGDHPDIGTFEDVLRRIRVLGGGQDIFHGIVNDYEHRTETDARRERISSQPSDAPPPYTEDRPPDWTAPEDRVEPSMDSDGEDEGHDGAFNKVEGDDDEAIAIEGGGGSGSGDFGAADELAIRAMISANLLIATSSQTVVPAGSE